MRWARFWVVVHSLWHDGTLQNDGMLRATISVVTRSVSGAARGRLLATTMWHIRSTVSHDRALSPIAEYCRPGELDTTCHPLAYSDRR